MSKATISNRLNANYENYYEDGASEWRRLCAIGKVENIIALCSALPHNSILEIGAGEGSVLKRLSESNFGEELYALEISSSGVEMIKKKNISRLIECNIFDGYNIPYDNNRFDIALLSHVIEHVEHPRQLLYEAARVANYIFIEVPLEDTLRLPRDFIFDTVGHINFYAPRSIRRLIQTCNLCIIHQVITNPHRVTYTYKKGIKGLIAYYVKQALLKMSPNIATGLFTFHSALVCKKGSK